MRLGFDIKRRLRAPTLGEALVVAASVAVFLLAAHFVATAAISRQQGRQLAALAEVALRRAETAVDFGAATLDEIIRRGPMACDPAALQGVRLQVYSRSAVKDIRLLDREGSVICSAFSETLEFDNGRVDRPDMLASSDKRLLLFKLDQIVGQALGVMRDVDDRTSLQAILGITPGLFDIMPAELRETSQVSLGLSNKLEVLSFKPAHHLPAAAASYRAASTRYPLEAEVRVDETALGGWDRESYRPGLFVGFWLGLIFGALATRATSGGRGPVADIDRGIALREFRPYYQPIFDLESRAIVGCEALARWVRADGAVIPPMSFIPLAESSGRIERITWLVLSTALAELNALLRSDKTFRLSVNIVPRHLLEDGFVEELSRTVREARVSARQIVLEITERDAFTDPAKAVATIAALRELGFRVAMDDVGVGHSGLSQIKTLGAQVLKIDKVFVDTIASESAAVMIVEMLVRLAQELQMTVVAEGIETVEQIHALQRCGVTTGQGYVVSPPLPLGRFEALLREAKRADDPAAAAPPAAQVA